MYVVRLNDMRNPVPLSGGVVISEADALAIATTNHLPFLFCSQNANTTNHASISKLYFCHNRCLVNPLALSTALCFSSERASRAAGNLLKLHVIIFEKKNRDREEMTASSSAAPHPKASQLRTAPRRSPASHKAPSAAANPPCPPRCEGISARHGLTQRIDRLCGSENVLMMWWLCSARMGRGGSVDRLFGSGRCRSEQQLCGLLLVWVTRRMRSGM